MYLLQGHTSSLLPSPNLGKLNHCLYKTLRVNTADPGAAQV